MRRRQEFQIVHTHGLWCMTSVYPHYLRRSGKLPRIVSAPRGQMSKWALNRSKWKKKLMWWAFQKRALSRVDCFQATAVKELQEIRKLGFKQPVALVPNGIDIPVLMGQRNIERHLSSQQLASHNLRRLLYLGRIHPVKGIDILLKSWARLQSDFAGWELVVAGPGELSHIAEMKALTDSLELQRVRVSEGVYGDTKSALYQSADLYVLPSHTENYGMTVVESLACATPVLTTLGTPWDKLENHQAGWTIDLSEENLTQGLRAAMSLPKSRLSDMGQFGRSWVTSEFSWSQIAERMADVYQWLLGAGSQPSCVIH